MADANKWNLARVLGVIVLVLAWTAAAIEYSKSGEIRWSLIAAGVFFAAMPFSASAMKKS